MEFKGTKGVWSVDKRASLRIASDKDVTIASTSSGQSGENLEQEKANAKLIAAAPDLLKACQEALKHHQGGHSEIGMKLKSAIKKAIG